MNDHIRRGRQLRVSLRVRLTLVTKNLSVVFDHDAIERLRIYFTSVCVDFESKLLDLKFDGDQVTLLVAYPPKHSVSAIVDSLKGVSSRMLRASRSDIRRKCVEGALWSPSYDAVSVDG
jgi:putative transposase